LLKIEHEASISEAKSILHTIIEKMHNHTDYKAVRFIFDVDPV
jgi:hypothetical protein